MCCTVVKQQNGLFLKHNSFTISAETISGEDFLNNTCLTGPLLEVLLLNAQRLNILKKRSCQVLNILHKELK